MTAQPPPILRDRAIGAAVALVLGIGMAWLPVFARSDLGGVPLNGVWIAVTTLVAFWLAPNVRDATPRRLLLIVFQMTLTVIVASALVSGTWMALSVVLDPTAPPVTSIPLFLLPLGFAAVGLILFGLVGVAFGVPAAGVWAATVRYILSRDIGRR